MNVLCNKPNMDDLATEAVGLGRQVADRAKALRLGDNAKDVAFVSRCFAGLREVLAKKSIGVFITPSLPR